MTCHQSTKILTLTFEIGSSDDPDPEDTELEGTTFPIYAQCDPDGNQYVLLEALVDHRRNDKASYYYAMSMIPLL